MSLSSPILFDPQRIFYIGNHLWVYPLCLLPICMLPRAPFMASCYDVTDLEWTGAVASSVVLVLAIIDAMGPTDCLFSTLAAAKLATMPEKALRSPTVVMPVIMTMQNRHLVPIAPILDGQVRILGKIY